MKKGIFLISCVGLALLFGMFPLSAVWAQGKVVEIKKHGVNIRKLPSQTAEYKSRYADTKGSTRMLDSNSYSGRVDGNTLILDYNVSAEEKLTNPIMMYYSCRTSSLAVDGVLYQDDSAM